MKSKPRGLRSEPVGRGGWTRWHRAPRFRGCCDCHAWHEAQYQRDGDRLYTRVRCAVAMTRKARRKRK